jgi:hypothetical protein
VIRSAREYVCASSVFGTVRNKDGLARTIWQAVSCLLFVGPGEDKSEGGEPCLSFAELCLEQDAGLEDIYI